MAALECFLLLTVIASNWLRNRTFDKSIVVFLVAFIGSVVNAMAPGNFARHSEMDTEIRLVNSIGSSFVRINYVISQEIQFGILLLVIIVSFLIGYFISSSNKIEIRLPGVITICGYIGVAIVDFPVILGYSDTYMPERCIFIERIAILIFVMVSTFGWGAWLKQKNIFRVSVEFLIVIGIVCVVTMSKYIDYREIMEITPYKICAHMANGDYEKANDTFSFVIDRIKESEEDVIVWIEPKCEDFWTNIKDVGLREDNNFWINKAVADYYGKRSIALKIYG